MCSARPRPPIALWYWEEFKSWPKHCLPCLGPRAPQNETWQWSSAPSCAPQSSFFRGVSGLVFNQAPHQTFTDGLLARFIERGDARAKLFAVQLVSAFFFARADSNMFAFARADRNTFVFVRADRNIFPWSCVACQGIYRVGDSR